MVRNLNTIERAIRLLVGVMILGLFGALASPMRYLALAGLIPLGTALTGHCPVYHALVGRVRRSPSPGRAGRPDTRL